ncbi:hypothetical protein FEMY_20310 [Ferrovum myxofaciens]|uniref:Uncharacterized protein n=1 Tax=Ferrovum myxofaciens TaxID=416213 RepID=A0A149VW62_9PROT|nr:hypothetical protein FEMY_20310 [Ferrovum myxofaciens]
MCIRDSHQFATGPHIRDHDRHSRRIGFQNHQGLTFADGTQGHQTNLGVIAIHLLMSQEVALNVQNSQTGRKTATFLSVFRVFPLAPNDPAL